MWDLGINSGPIKSGADGAENPGPTDFDISPEGLAIGFVWATRGTRILLRKLSSH